MRRYPAQCAARGINEAAETEAEQEMGRGREGGRGERQMGGDRLLDGFPLQEILWKCALRGVELDYDLSVS